MADVHDYLRRVMTTDETFDWLHIVAALHELAGEENPSSASVELAKELARLDREVEVQDHSAPHALSPTESIRSYAVQALARWDASLHRHHIDAVATSSSSELLRAIARDHLP